MRCWLARSVVIAPNDENGRRCYFEGTRCLSSSVQLRTTSNCLLTPPTAEEFDDDTSATNRLPSGMMSASRPKPGPRPPYTLNGKATGSVVAKPGSVVTVTTNVRSAL